MKLQILIIVIYLTIGILSSYQIAKAYIASKEPLVSPVSYSPIPSTEHVAAKQPKDRLPKTLLIPKIGVEANIEQVGLDQENKMDVPKDVWNVGWYSLGYTPGQNGSAVMAGHLDDVGGKPAVFHNLTKIQIDDEVIVKDEAGNSIKFKVIRIQAYPYDQFPLEEVFTIQDKPRLNLITCEGIWDKSNRTYSHRTVVYTEMI